MISFIHCEKRVYMFPRSKKLTDARKELTSYMDAQ